MWWTLLIAVVVVAAAVLALVLAVAGEGGGRVSADKAAESLILTETDQRWLLAGRSAWSSGEALAWERLVATAERYETPSGKRRLKLEGLTTAAGDFRLLEELVRRSIEAIAEENEDRWERWSERFQAKLYKALDRHEAKAHWWNELDAAERAENRRMGIGWRDYLQG